MLDHHIQRSIVYRLAFADKLRFSDLQPDALENKLFTYHLKKVVRAGYAAKDSAGFYSLTPEGRRLGIRLLDKQSAAADQPESVLFLAVRRESDSAWLLYRRNTHPLLGLSGFMHANPNADEDCAQTARQICHEKTGLSGDFRVLGGGYFRVYRKDELESFTHFTLLACDDARGDLVQNDPYAEYFWQKKPNFTAKDMLPDMPILHELYQNDQLFFIEQDLKL
jgi:hypothetical protein